MTFYQVSSRRSIGGNLAAARTFCPKLSRIVSPWTNICQLYISLPGTNLDLPGPGGRFQEVEVEGDGVAAVAERYVPGRFVVLRSPSLFSCPGQLNR